MAQPAGRVALLWRGDPQSAETATLEGNRLAGAAAALRAVGLAPEPVIFSEEIVDRVRQRLLGVDGVLVWANPLEDGRDRTVLDALLRDVANAGIPVSAHPDTILKMGTKAVLYDTRHVGWGCDTRLYTDHAALCDRLPGCLAEGRPRVLKQYRGNGGIGVWKVELAAPHRGPGAPAPETAVRVRHAQRGSPEDAMPLGDFLARCAPYFAGGGRMIDQEYQDRLTDGMVRCYLVRDRVAGFGEQLVNLLHPPPAGGPRSAAPLPGPRLYYPPTRPDFQPLRRKLEAEWVPAMLDALALGTDALPVIWDADFLYGPKDAQGEDSYVLCEINVSSVYPFPEEALGPLAAEARARLEKAGRL